jgi:plasmid stabilization system protein ParE
MAENLRIEWSDAAAAQLDKFYNYILEHWSLREAERFLDQVQEFEAVLVKHPKAFIQSRRKKKYRIGLVHKHVSAIYSFSDDVIFIIALIDNRGQDSHR